MNKHTTDLLSGITAALTTLAALPYQKEDMDLIGSLVPHTWIPWVIKIGIGSTLALRGISWWQAKNQPTLTATSGTASPVFLIPPTDPSAKL